MTPRNLLVRGLLAGLLAGLFAFAVAYAVGEPQVDAAIAVEEAGAADDSHSHDQAEDDAVEISRTTQSTWGLLTGTLAVGTALGGLTALAVGLALGRLDRSGAGATTALVSLIGFVSVSLVPFSKYPATPPAVGDPATIGDRTTWYFGFLALSVLAALAAVALAARLLPRLGTYRSVLAGTAAYLVVVVAAGAALPAVNEVGDFPADTLWHFRTGSLLTLAALWAGIGVTLTGMVGRLHRRATEDAARRELAATL